MSKVFLFVAIEVQPGKTGAFLEKLKNQIEIIRGEDGCEAIDIFKNSADENLLHVWEVWSNRESWDVHMANDASNTWQAIASDFVIGEKITVMNSL
jgi:(4S)-4-hydroxy-5-phosphonooxypentane-2,3-dione isomerase